MLSLAAGYGPFSTPSVSITAARVALSDPARLRPAPAQGLPVLREAIATRYQRTAGVAVDPARVVITPGTKLAVHVLLQTVLQAGDEVLIPTPNWFGFHQLMARAVGATLKLLPLDPADAYALHPAAIVAALTPQTKLLILTNPSNPTGRVYTLPELEAVLKAVQAARPDIWILSDEIYDGITFGQQGTPAPTVLALPDPGGRHVVINGFSKSVAMAGWRVGYLVTPPALAPVVTKYLLDIVSSVSPLNQLAVAAATDAFEAITHKLLATLIPARDLILCELERLGIAALPTQGAYYAFADLRPWQPQGYTDPAAASAALIDRLRDSHELLLIDGATCGAPGFARITFATTETELREGLSRLARGLGI